VASNPPPDLALTAIGAPSRTVSEWVTMFHLVFVAVDPFNERSAWLVDTAGRILSTYEQADCRVAWLVTGTPDEARQFLGRWSRELLTFTDPDYRAVRAFGLATLPAIVHVGMDGAVVNAVEGWEPEGWRKLSEELSRIVDWSKPVIPGPRDPAPFAGAPYE
jgi:hypothetical protein